MRRRLAPLLLATAVVPALVLAGCGSSASPLEGVSVEGGWGETPVVEVDTPLEVEATTSEPVPDVGSGEEGDQVLAEGDVATVRYLGVNGRDGSTFDSSYERGTPAVFPLEQDAVIDGFLDGLVGAAVGSRVLIGVSPADGYGGQGGIAEAGIEAGDSLLFVVDVVAGAARAEGEAVPPQDGLPVVTLEESTGEPTIEVPGGEPPADLVVQPLIEGEGEAVPEGGTAYVRYTGALWSDGTVFDSSWERNQSFPVSVPPVPEGAPRVIPGWEQGLSGARVGSQLLLVIPPDLGYGDQDNGEIPAGSTLVFVVDVLAATGPPS